MNQLNFNIMKRIFLLLATIGFFGLQSCTSPEGVPGKNGQDAPLTQVIDVFSKSFTESNDFSNLITFNQRIMRVVTQIIITKICLAILPSKWFRIFTTKLIKPKKPFF